MNKIKPLFFPGGKFCHCEVDDILTDVKGTQLMHGHECKRWAAGELIVINPGSDIPTSDGLQQIHGGDVGLPQLQYGLPLTDLAPEDLPGEFIIDGIIARSVRNSGVIDFGPFRPYDCPLDNTRPGIVRTIIVHRGQVYAI